MNKARGKKTMHVKKGDVVRIVAGEDKGKQGKVLQVLPGGDKVLVEGVNYVKRHMRKSQDNPQGGIVEKEAMMHVSNVAKVKSSEGKESAKNA